MPSPDDAFELEDDDDDDESSSEVLKNESLVAAETCELNMQKSSAPSANRDCSA